MVYRKSIIFHGISTKSLYCVENVSRTGRRENSPDVRREARTDSMLNNSLLPKLPQLSTLYSSFLWPVLQPLSDRLLEGANIWTMPQQFVYSTHHPPTPTHYTAMTGFPILFAVILFCGIVVQGEREYVKYPGQKEVTPAGDYVHRFNRFDRLDICCSY